MNSNISLEEKYDALKEFQYHLPKKLQEEYGQKFFRTSLKTNLELVDENIVINIRGLIYPNFRNKTFTEGLVSVTSNISFTNKELTAIYLFEDIDFSRDYFEINILQPLDNSLDYGLGTANELITIDSSFLSYIAESIDGHVDLKVWNQVGDEYHVVISLFDLTKEWNSYVNDKNEQVIFLNKDYYSNNSTNQEKETINYSNKNRSENQIYESNINLDKEKYDKNYYTNDDKNIDYEVDEDVYQALKNTNDNTPEIEKQVKQMFADYVPILLKSKGKGSKMSSVEVYLGDLNNDGMEDAVVLFSYRYGGASFHNEEFAVYLNVNGKPKVVAGFEPEYRMNVLGIENGLINIIEFDWDNDDGNCCPSIEIPKKLKLDVGTIKVWEKKLLNETNQTRSVNNSHATYTKTMNLSFARKYEGKYMFGPICETEPLKSKLINLLGSELHKKFISYIAVQVPMEISNNKTLLTSCMAHACSIYESSLFIDFSKNHFYAGILDDTDVYVISNNLNFNSKEFDSYPTEFLEWTKDALEIAKENK
jgi:hypothetical protein